MSQSADTACGKVQETFKCFLLLLLAVKWANIPCCQLTERVIYWRAWEKKKKSNELEILLFSLF